MSEIFRVSPTPTLVIKADYPHYTIIGANDAYLEATKSSNEDIIGKKIFEAFPLNPTDQYYSGVKKLALSLEIVFRTGETHTMDPLQYDIPVRGTDDFEEKFWQAKNIPILDEHKNVVQILHTVSDITASSQTITKLNASETKYKELVHSMDAIIWEADGETYQYTYISPQAKDMLGYNMETWFQQDFWIQHVHPDDREKVLAYSRSQIETRKNHHNLYRLITKDNSIIWISDMVSVSVDPEGKVKLRGVMTDVTSRITAEQKAAENQAKIGKILENSLDIICAVDAAGYFTEVSAASESILGYRPNELLGNLFLDYVHPEDRKMSAIEAEDIMKGDATSSFENRYIHKNGKSVYMMWSAKWDDSEKVMYCIGKDGTFKKTIEKKLLYSEQRFKSLVQYGADFIAILDQEGKYSYASLNAESIIGFAPEDLVGIDAFSLIHKDDLSRVYASFQRLIGGEKMIADTFRYKNGDGKYQWMETIAIDMRDNPAVGGIVVNSRDVSDKKHYTEWHEYVNKATNNVIYDWDMVEDHVQWGGFTSHIFHPFELENSSLDTWIKKLHPDERAHVLADQKKIIASHDASHFNSEYRMINVDGEYLDIIEDGFFIRNDSGEAIRMIGALRDVTERKKFETELQISNQRYDLVTQATSDAIWDWDLTTNSLYWGEGFQKLFGHQPEKLHKDIRSWNLLIHPKDANRINDQIKNVIYNGDSTWEGEYRFKKSSGDYVYVYDRGYVQRNSEGKAIRMVGAMQNIHQDKMKEVEDGIKLSISKIFTSEISLEATFKKTIKLLLDHSEASYGEVWLINTDQNSISLSAHYGKGTYTIDKDYLQINVETGLAGEVISHRKPHLIEEIKESELFLRKNFAEDNGYQSVWANPIIYNEEIRAIIFLYYKKIQQIDSSHPISNDILNLLGSEVQRKKAETELNLFFDLSPDFLCIIDFEGKYIKANQKFLQEIGPIVKDGKHLTYDEYTHPEDMINIDDAIQVLHSGKPAYNESRYKTSSGDYIWVGWDTAALTDQAFYFTIGKDITIRKQQEKALAESNSKLSETLESIQDGFFALDFDWKVTYWNKEAERMLSTKREDILGKMLWESFPEAIKLLFFKEYNRAMKDREIVNFEEYFPPLGIWFGVSAFPSDSGITVYFKDITDRKNESLSLLQFKNVIENSQDEIAIISTVNEDIYLNQAYKQTLGYSIDKIKILGGPQKVFASEDIAAEVFSTLLSGQHWKGDVELVSQERKLLSYHISGGPIFDQEGKLVAVFLIHTNISQRKEIEEKLKDLYADLKLQTKALADSHKELEQFAHVASNDLQVPLNSIIENLQILHKVYLKEDGHPYLQEAISKSARLQFLIDGLMEYTLMGRGKGEIEKVDLNEVVSDINKALRKQIVDKFAIIDVPAMPIVKGHRKHLERIFKNIILNSLTYCDDRPHIVINFESSKTHWLFTVKDNGTGFDPTDVERIFNLFQSLDGTHNPEGKGMGLAIAKKLVEEHKGNLWAETELNEGSTFHFTISKDL